VDESRKTATTYMSAKLITHVEVEMAATVISVTHHRIPVIEAQRSDWQIKPEPNTDIRSHMVKAERPSARIDETGVVKNCPPGFFYNWESPFNRRARH